MKTALLLLLSLSIALVALPVRAEEPVLSSRSLGKYRADTTDEFASALAQQEAVTRTTPPASEDYASRARSQLLEGVANRYDQLFAIFEADVHTVSDLDGDGYHHAINVFFDVDVSTGGATVYAKLYLSREGGPWIQYFTSDLFEIYLDDSGDAYEVATELLEGYPPGYYDVLVEIYSLDHAYLVASEVLDHHYLGKDVMIEDLARDEPYEDHSGEYVYEEEVYYSSGGGSMTWLLLAFLMLQVVIAARGALAQTPLSPRNDSEI